MEEVFRSKSKVKVLNIKKKVSVSVLRLAVAFF